MKIYRLLLASLRRPSSALSIAVGLLFTVFVIGFWTNLLFALHVRLNRPLAHSGLRPHSLLPAIALVGIGAIFFVHLARWCFVQFGRKKSAYGGLLFVLFMAVGFQTHTFPALDTNNVFTGSNTYQGAVLAKILEGCQVVDPANALGWAGADFGTWVNAAATAAGANGTVCAGNGNYTYTNDVVLSAPLALICPGQRCLLTYNGSGKAMKLGPDGLTIGTANPEPYTVYGFEFNGGGATWTAGIYHNRFVIKSFIINTRFINSGNSSAYNIFYQAENWYSNLNNVYMWGTSSGPCYNGIMVNDVAADNTTYDSGDSFIRFLGVHVQNLASGCSTTTGINVNSFGADFSQVDVLGGFHNLVRLRKGASRASFSNFYGEQTNPEAGACGILYGDLGTDPASAVSNYIDSLHAGPNFYINVHNTDFTTTAHAFCPATATTGAQNWNLQNVAVAQLTAGQPVVVLNNNTSQGGNCSSYTQVSTAGAPFAPGTGVGASLHTAGGNITRWCGVDEDLTSYGNVVATSGVGTFGSGTVSAPALTSGSTGIGWWNNGGHMEYAQGGASTIGLFAALLQGKSTTVYGWSGSAVNAATDSGVSRCGAAEVCAGNGTQGDKTAQMDMTSLQIQATAFASLGTPANGTVKFCNDCTVANPCAGSGTGALAKRLNGAWVCN